MIALDASTTSLQVAKQLPNRPLTVITYSLVIVNELIKKNEIKLIVIGGNLDTDAMAMTGMPAENMLDGYHIDKFFFSCQGFDLLRGLPSLTNPMPGLNRRSCPYRMSAFFWPTAASIRPAL